jgi:hypothetical protein
MLSDYGEDYYANLMVGNATPVVDWFLALLVEIPYPTVEGSVLLSDFEVQDDAYARQYVMNTDFSYSSGGIVSTNIPFYWPAAVTDWEPVVGFAILDDPEEGNVYVFGEFPDHMVVEEGQQLYIPAGMISIGISTTEAGDDD